MKRIIKNNLLGFILGAIIFGSIGTIAANYAANTIGFTPKNTNWKKEDGTDITNVKDALDDLYNRNKLPSKIRYFKLIITKTKSTPDRSTMQISEFVIYNKNQSPYSFPSSTTISSTLVGNNGEDITKLIDNDISTKYCTASWGSTANGYNVIQIDLGENNYLDLSEYIYYSFYTANDLESRDPSTWYLYGSEDGTKYYLLDYKYDYKMPSSRKTQSELWKISSNIEYIYDNN